ncbi:MAG: hypothetical protein KDE22_06480 [Rhodobacterales bacterium]|nr:hypothetical protein [Rhodobacterales bacterium]
MSTHSARRAAPADSTSVPATACFSVHAAADCSVMPRVVQVFAKRGLLPSQLHSSLGGDDGDQLQIDVQVPDVDARTADLLAQSLRQIVMVECVLTSEKRPAEAGEARAA